MHYNAYFLVRVLNVSELEAISSIHCIASSIKLGMEFYKIKKVKNFKIMWYNHLEFELIIIIILIAYSNKSLLKEGSIDISSSSPLRLIQ